MKSKLLSGEVKLHEIEKHLPYDKACTTRREFLEEKTGVSLHSLSNLSFDSEIASKGNIENLIGTMQIPIGISSPLRVVGEYADGEFYIPLATTEKSLIASISRGCKAISLSGGAKTIIQRDAMKRAPLFRTRTLAESKQLINWIEKNFQILQLKASEISSHAKLDSSTHWIVGRDVFVSFEYTTGDAMGMNVTTRISDAISRYIVSKLPFVKFESVSSNMCIDKKPSALNLINGRGKSVHAEVLIPKEIVQTVLKSEAKKMEHVFIHKNLIGSAHAGSLGFNAHFSNTIGAIFLATGQDIAQVVEGSQGFTVLEAEENGDLYAAISIPALEVATIGGGTRLAPQKAVLKTLGVYGTGDPIGSNAKSFAEIIAGAVLAGELSLIAALSKHKLAEAHKKTYDN